MTARYVSMSRARTGCAAVLAGLCTALAGLMGLSGAAQAHPHVWVVAQARLIVENGSVVAIRHRWVFDEGYTKMAIDGLDANGDGKYDRKELAELAAVNIEGLKEFAYFTQVKLGPAAVANGEPKDYHLDYDDQGILALHFTLMLSKPVLLEAADLAISVGDPSAFIDFSFAKTDPISLEGAPANCKAELKTPPKAAEATAKLGQAFAAEMQGMVNITVPQEIRIACAG